MLSYSCDEAQLPALTGQPERDYGEDVGSYRIHQGSLALAEGYSSNYVLNFVEGLLTVDVAGNDVYGFSCGRRLCPGDEFGHRAEQQLHQPH